MADQRRDVDQLIDGFWVGDWYVEPRSNSLTGPGEPLRIEPKVMQVLVCLARQPGKTVTKTVFMEQVWDGTIVTDDVLARCISQLRKVFDDDTRKPRYIETIRKRGYRLIAPVALPSREADNPSALQVRPPEPAMTRRRVRLFNRRVGVAVFVLGLLVGGAVGLYATFGSEAVGPPSTVPFTSFPGEEFDPALSPDGEQVVFAWKESDEATVDLFIKQTGAETPLRLTDDPAIESSPAWSPDGRQIAFVRFADDESSIVIVPAIGGSERTIVSLGTRVLHGLAWSPDGKTLALSAERAPKEAFSIYLLSVETFEQHALTNPPVSYIGDVDPAWSPDGRRIAFMRIMAEDNADIFVTQAADTTSPRQLTSDRAGISGLDWTTDGKAIVFASRRDGDSSLWRIPASGGEPEWIAAAGEGRDLQQPSIARNASRLTYTERIQDMNIWQIGRTGTPHSRLISSTRWDSNPQVSPDGQRIAFASKRSGNHEIWLCDRDGENPVQLTSFENVLASTGTPRWSPDGQRIAFDARPNGQSDVYIIDAAGDTPQLLTDPGADDVSPSWSMDSTSVYFASNRSGDWQIWKQTPEGGEAKQITKDGGIAAFEAPDGKTLYFVRSDTVGIWQLPLDGTGEATQVIEAPEPLDWGNWVVREEGIYYIRRIEGRPEIAFYSFAAGRFWRLLRLNNIPEHPSFTVSPDGQWFIYTQIDRTESDILLVEDFH